MKSDDTRDTSPFGNSVGRALGMQVNDIKLFLMFQDHRLAPVNEIATSPSALFGEVFHGPEALWESRNQRQRSFPVGWSKERNVHALIGQGLTEILDHYLRSSSLTE